MKMADNGLVPIKRALVSVFDKASIEDLASALKEMGVAVISTGGTAKTLAASGLEVTDVSAVTNFPEMLDGRVSAHRHVSPLV